MKMIRLSDAVVTEDILVIGLAKVAPTATNKTGSLKIESGVVGVDEKNLLASLNSLGATGAANEITKLPGTSSRLLIFTGLGSVQKDYPHEVLRRAAGAAARSLAGEKGAAIAMPAKTNEQVAAIAEGITLGAYAFDEFRGTSKAERKAPLAGATVHTKLASTPAAKAAAKRAVIIGEYTKLVRDLINTPPSHLTPDSFTKRFSAAVKELGGTAAHLKVSILNEKQLRDGGYGGISGVGAGSANPPRLLHISYNPPKAKKKYAFVGKGITFDTGGYALKPAGGMEAMKSDMSGAAAVSAAILAIAALKLPIAIDIWAAMAENMISENATRPSDIHTMYGGKTIEVLNPDAEGRLVLADALVKAQESKMKLDGIIDVATLTGAQVVALGTRTSAVMTNNDEFREQFLIAADQAGEDFWPMPLPEELRASLDSPVADMANIGERMGGMLVAGLFLKEFIPDELPWLHLDIAGPAYNEAKAHGYTPIGGTGVAFRSLIRLAEIASVS